MRSLKLSSLFVAFMILFSLNGNAQLVSTYTYSYDTATYVAITGTVLVSGTNSWDDTVFTNIPLGFTFNFEGQSYTSIGVNSNGFIWFGSGATNKNVYSPISQTTLGTGTIAGVVAAYGNDLFAYPSTLSYAPSGTPNISYQTSLVGGDSVFTVQWKGANSHNDPGSGSSGYNDLERIDLQIKLYRSNNGISVIPRINPFPYISGSSGQVGIRGSSISDFQSLSPHCSGSIWNGATANQSTNVGAIADLNPCYPAGNVGGTHQYNGVYSWAPATNPCPAVSITGQSSTNACSGGLGSISITATGTGPLVYIINNGTVADTNLTGNFTNLAAGTYTVAVSNGLCTQRGANITISSSSAIGASSNSPLCPGATLHLSSSSFTGATYSWSGPDSFSAATTNASRANVTAADSGDYIVAITVPGCSAVNDTVHVVIDTCTPVLDTVWPGDANNNGIASFQDILYIGIAFGDVGPVRPGASNSWTAQTCPLWANSFLSGVNHNHADCNGDGVVDINDTAPVMLNLGMTHPKSGTQRSPGSPVLGLRLASQQASSGDDVTLDVLLGDTSIYAYDVYGLTFGIAYDNTLIDAGSFTADFSHSWIGATGANMLTVAKDDHANGQFNIALTRTDHIDHSGFGPIAQIHFKASQLPNGVTLAQLPLSIASYTSVDFTGTTMPLDNKPDTLTVQSTAGINSVNEASLSLFPNPAFSKLSLTSGQDITSYAIYNPADQVVLHNDNMKSTNANIDIQSLSQGIYVLQATINQQKVTRRFAVVK